MILLFLIPAISDFNFVFTCAEIVPSAAQPTPRPIMVNSLTDSNFNCKQEDDRHRTSGSEGV